MPSYEAQLKALGDPTRREILDRLRRRPMAVGELAAAFPISRPAISQHLKILKDARLVVDRAEGNRRVYAIDERGFALVRAYAEQFTGGVGQPEAEPDDDSWRNW